MPEKKALDWLADEHIPDAKKAGRTQTWDEIVAGREVPSYEPLLPAAHKQRGQHVGRG